MSEAAIVITRSRSRKTATPLSPTLSIYLCNSHGNFKVSVPFFGRLSCRSPLCFITETQYALLFSSRILTFSVL